MYFTELKLFLTSMSTFLKEPFRKIELRDLATRAQRLLAWRIEVKQRLAPLGTHAEQWWTWCLHQADETHKQFISTPVHSREHLVPTADMPEAWHQVEI